MVAVEVMRSRQILDTQEWETEPSRLADRLNEGYEREKGVKADSKILSPGNGKDRVAK